MSVTMDVMASTKPLVSLLMDDAQLRRLDDFRFANRFDSRGAAIRWMIDDCLARGSKPNPERPKSARAKRTK